jgi:hypothetical protein
MFPFRFRFGHGSEISKLASSKREEQTDYVVGVSSQPYHSTYSGNFLLLKGLRFPCVLYLISH